MKNIDLNYICKVIGNLSGVPIRVYSGTELLFYYSIVALPKDPSSSSKLCGFCASASSMA